jgi:hypothetical protein
LTGRAGKVLPNMSFRDILQRKRSAILERWFGLILDSYPPDASEFLKKQNDPFANPVGNTISRGIKELFDELVDGANSDTIVPILDQIVRIRAVQDFSPSQAVGFVFELKKSIRREMAKELRTEADESDLQELERRIDMMALLAFDIYMLCREKVYDIKANEAKNRTFILLERAGLVSELPEEPNRSSQGNGEGSR